VVVFLPSSRTISTTSPLLIDNGASADLSANRTLSIPKATTLVDGYLASTDFLIFNSKQSAGAYLTGLSGDVGASGPGVGNAVLANVNLNVGSFTNANITVDAKGRITAAANGSGGGGSPGGSNTQLQFNSASTFGGVTGATSDGTNVTFGAGNLRTTNPRITTGILDANGNSILAFTAVASAVDGFTMAGSATGSPATVTLSATGSDTDIDMLVSPKGTGKFRTSAIVKLQQSTINDAGWAGTGSVATMFYGADSQIGSPINSPDASLVFQTSRSGGALGVGVFGYEFGFNKISGPGDTYVVGFLNRYSPNMNLFANGDYNQHGVIGHVVLSPTNKPAGANVYGYNVMKTERTVNSVRGVGLQSEVVNNSGVDADDDGTSLNSMIAHNAAGGGANFNSIAYQIEAGVTGATSFGVGVRPKRNSVRLYLMDFVAGGLYDLTGTLTVVQNSATITGSGTKFTQELRKYDLISVDGVNWYELASTPVSNTSATLTHVYNEVNNTGLVITKNRTASSNHSSWLHHCN
jgi:hypothetical protein